jgi:DNA repair exonuclease SbcCD ATPase subunit
MELHGFRGFREYADIDVPDGFLVIQGANGAGKSTICDAVEFCLTGGIDKYPIEKAAKETVADYIWWRGEGTSADHFVRIHFLDKDGAPFVITRTPDSCDQSVETIKDRLCSVDSPDGALKVLTETTLIRDESIAALSLDITETERYQRVQRALGAIQSRDLSDRADKVIKKTDELNKANIASEDAIRKELTASLARLSEVRTLMVEDKELQQAEGDLKTLIPDAPSVVGDLIVSARNWLSANQSEVQNRLAMIARLVTLFSELAAIQTPEFLEHLEAVEGSAARLEALEEATRAEVDAAEKAVALEREADALAASLAALLAHGSDVGLHEGHCPLCESALSNEQFRAAIERGQARLARIGGGAAAAEASLNAALAKLSNVTNDLELARRALTVLRARKESARTVQTQVDDLLGKARVSAADVGDPSLSERISNQAREMTLFVEQRLRALEGSRAVAQLRELEEKIRTLRSEADRITLLVGRTQRASSASKSIQHAITRTAGELLDERLATISPLLSELFLRLKPHGDWRNIEYRIRGDVRRFLSLAVGGDLNPQFVFSSGQRRITGLAFLLSVHLSRHWCNWQTLMLDDPVQHIDDYRALNLVEVLAAIRRDGRQIICAVEDVALANVLCRRLGTRLGQSGALLTLESGPQGVARIKRSDVVKAGSLRILDRISGSGGQPSVELGA